MTKRNRNIKNIFIKLQMGTNIMANQVKTPIQNYFPLPQFLKVGRTTAPSSFAFEVVLVKFELQTHMEHLSSCQFGFLVV
jgi:hypothetical protein